jgi:hypothetical protein
MKIKIIKRAEREAALPSPPPTADSSAADPKQWSSAVKSWVTQLQADREEESVTAFDSLFGDSST